MSEVKRKDQELYDQWKASGSKQDLSKLINQLSPLIYSEVQRVSGSLPPSALAAEAKHWAVKAIENYDPTRGASISTHVVGYLPKVRRMNYKFQNVVRLPENLQLKYHEYNQGITGLNDRLNREPTDEEIAEELGWSKPSVIKYKNSLYADLVESASVRPTEYVQFNQGKIHLDYILSQLTPEEKIIFDNDKELNSTQLAEKLGVNINRLNYLKAKTIKKIQDIKNQIGMY